MNSSKIIVVLLTAITLSGLAKAESFIRPTGGYYFFNDSKYSDKAGFGIAGGSAYGDQNAHELSLEWNYVKWSYLSQPPPGILGGSIVRGSGHIQPVLFNYRYRFGTENAKLRFYVGPSIGFTNIQGNLMSSNASPYYASGSYGKWSLTHSASAGVQIKLLQNLSLDAGLRYLWIKEVDATLPVYLFNGTPDGSTRTLNLGNTKAIALQAGLHVAF
jgi:opacity protein-like surface antigen